MLRIDQLVAGYGAQPIARLEQLELQPGEAARLVGPSGVGKTTLLLGIAGLARVFGGGVTIDGTATNTLGAGQRDRFRGRHIGMVFQDLHLVAGLSALDNILLAPFAGGVKQDKARALSLLEALGLGGFAKRPAEKLSRGQAQRVAIARAMLLKPKVLLADEPTASLDDQSCAIVCDLLLNAASEAGAALVIATHDARLHARVPRSVSVAAAQ